MTLMERYLIGASLLAALIVFLNIRKQLRQRADEDDTAAADERNSAPKVVSNRFRPSTLKLIRAMEWQKDRRYVMAVDEPILLGQVLQAVNTAMHSKLDKETWRHGIWPVPLPIVGALREALRDHIGTSAGEALAQLLARTGASEDDVLEELHPWDRVAFIWQKEGLTAVKIAQILREAALIDTVSASSMTQLDGWIARPVSALLEAQTILEVLFGESRVTSALVADDDADEPNHPFLFEQLLRHAPSPVLINELEQRRYEDTALVPAETITLIQHSPQETSGDVLFTYAGKRYRFTFKDQGWHLDVASVMNAADKLLMDLGYVGRTFRFQAYSSDAQCAYFITAPEAAFREVAERLHLPLYAP